MPNLGDTVIYTVSEAQRAQTLKGVGNEKQVLIGSTFHPELTSFSAIIGKDNGDGSFELMMFVPAKPPVWVNSVREGDGAGCFAMHLPAVAVAGMVAATENAASSASDAQAAAASAAQAQAAAEGHAQAAATAAAAAIAAKTSA